MQPLNLTTKRMSNKRMASSNPLSQTPTKKILKEIPPMLLKIKTAEQKQLGKVKEKVEQVNNRIEKFLKVQKFMMHANDINKRIYATITNSKITKFNYPYKNSSQDNKLIPNHHYCIENNNEIINLIDYDNNVNVTLLKKNNTENRVNVATFYKNNPNMLFKYQDEDTTIVKYDNTLQDIKIQKDFFCYNYDSKTQTIYKDFHTKIGNKDIYFSRKYMLNKSNQLNNVYCNYIEKEGEKTKGYFINDKMNGDGHTGVIAFTPKEI